MIKVFITGVWDLLHIGHVRVLEEAAALGDWLCVGIMTDDMAASYKERPTIPERERMEMVAALRCADEIIYHDSWLANIDFLAANKFSIRCVAPQHGGQHPLQLEAQRRSEEAGMKYRILLRTPGVSSTIIKERIRNEKG